MRQDWELQNAEYCVFLDWCDEDVFLERMLLKKCFFQWTSKSRKTSHDLPLKDELVQAV